MNTLYKSIRLLFEWLLTPITMLPALLRTYRQLFYIFSGAWEQREGKKLWCFSEQDVPFRGWYEKLANDFAIRGRFGYAWDNGAGDNLGVKVYNNWVTYWILGKLGSRNTNGLAIGIFALVFIGMTWLQFGWLTALLALFFVIPSPLVVTHFIRNGKPECIFWGVSLLAMILLFSGYYMVAGLLWTVIAFCNLPAAAMCAIFVGPAACVEAYIDEMLPQLFVSLIPGVVKTVWRLKDMYSSGVLQAVGSEQFKMATVPWFLTRTHEILFFFPIIVSLSACYWTTSQPLVLFLLFWIFGVSWLNDRVIRYEDNQSVHFFVISTALSVTLTSGNVTSLAVLFYSFYPPIQYVQAQFPSVNKKMKHNDKIRLYRGQYPRLSPRSYEISPSLDLFFSHIPPYTRFIAEFDGDPRSQSPMRIFWSYLDLYRARRQINFFNDIYLRIFAPKISKLFANRFCVEFMDIDEMDAHLHYFGIQHVVAYTDTMCNRMEAMGYKHIADTRPDYQQIFKGTEGGYNLESLHALHPILHIFRTSVKDGIVSGTNSFSVEGKKIYFTAEAGMDYVIRLLYSNRFHFLHDGKEAIFCRQYHEVFDVEPFIAFSAIKSGVVTITHNFI